MKRAAAAHTLAPALLAAGLVLGLPAGAAAQGRNIRFDRLSLEDGLSQGAVNCILQDRRGFMWFCTEDGLDRYDGYEFKVFKHDPGAPGSLSHDFVWSAYEDARGVLWFGTDGGGLNRWNERDGTFTVFRNDPSSPSSLSHDKVWAIHEDRQGALWIGTDGGGLNRFDRATGAFTRFNADPANPESLAHGRIRAIHEDRRGALWIGTYGGGLDRFEPATGTFVHHRHDPQRPDSLGDDQVRVIHEDRQGALWVGTYGGTLNRRDPETGRWMRYRNDPADPASLSAGRVRTVFQDRAGALWIGTDEGLSEWRPERRSFVRYQHDPSDPASLSDNRVSAIYQDRGGVLWVGTKGGGLNKWNATIGSFAHFRRRPDAAAGLSGNVVTSFAETRGTLWVGTYDGGLNRIDRRSGAITHLAHDPQDPASLSDNRVMSLLADRRGTLWIGTFDAGLNRLDPATGALRRFVHDPTDPYSLSANGVMSIHEDRRGVLWIGTFGGGLNRFDPRTGRFVAHRHDEGNPASLGSDRVTCFAEDDAGVLWIGTDGGGLSRYDRASGTYTHYRHDQGDPESLTSDVIWSLRAGRDGTLWIGTQGGGLNGWSRADRDANRVRFESYREREGLPNDSIYGILEDRQGNLWLSTNRGLSRFDLARGEFRNYDATHGTQSSEFNFGAHYRGAGGELFFGGNNGFNAFFPERVRHNDRVPPVVLTRFLKLDQPVALPRPVWDLREIELTHRDDLVSFEFAALDYTEPQKNRFAYKLEGFNEDWIHIGTARRATYTNLDPGDYVLRVKGANNDGVWNEQGVALAVRVVAPPWRRGWAYALYGLLLAGAATAGLRAESRRMARKERARQELEANVQARTLELAERNAELQMANLMLQEASLTDPLTGLRNRRFLLRHIQEEIQRAAAAREGARSAARADVALLFMMIDLDSLKEINDTHGHAAGDAALLQMRTLLQLVCRESDTLIRWGGDEFLVVGPCTDRRAAEGLAERVCGAVEAQAFDLGDGRMSSCTCSIGMAFYPFLPSAPGLLNWEQVVKVADRALYIAKGSGRNCWVGIFGTEQTPAVNLLQQICADPERLARRGAIDLRVSPRQGRRGLAALA